MYRVDFIPKGSRSKDFFQKHHITYNDFYLTQKPTSNPPKENKQTTPQKKKKIEKKIKKINLCFAMKRKPSWWFQIFLDVHPYLGKWIQFDEHIFFKMGRFNHQLSVSKNRGTAKSSILNRVFYYKPSILGYLLIEISITNHPFWGIPIFGNTQLVNIP